MRDDEEMLIAWFRAAAGPRFSGKETIFNRPVPSSARDAVNELWKMWWARELPEGKNVCAILSPTSDKWSASLCWQKKSGGALYKSTKQSGFTGSAQMDLPRQAFVVLPLSDVLAKVTTSLLALLQEPT